MTRDMDHVEWLRMMSHHPTLTCGERFAQIADELQALRRAADPERQHVAAMAACLNTEEAA